MELVPLKTKGRNEERPRMVGRDNKRLMSCLLGAVLANVGINMPCGH